MEREYEMTRFTVMYQNLKNMAQMYNKVSHYLKGKQGFIIVNVVTVVLLKTAR